MKTYKRVIGTGITAREVVVRHMGTDPSSFVALANKWEKQKVELEYTVAAIPDWGASVAEKARDFSEQTEAHYACRFLDYINMPQGSSDEPAAHQTGSRIARLR